MNRIMKVLSICTIVMLAMALMPAGSVLAALESTPPLVSNVTVTPTSLLLTGSAIVTAIIDDSTTGGSNILSGEYSLNGGGTWKLMSATSGSGTPTEAVSATFLATDAIVGTNQVCVRGTDAATPTNNVSDGTACANFTVVDNLPPVVSNVKVTAVMVGSTGTATVTATIDDSTTGGSNIASAAYTLNGGAPTFMTAADGSFNAVSEAVTAIINPISAGSNTVCVTGTDLPGNTSAPTCVTFTLFVFKGFLPPIRMDMTNKANAPQTIPIKWWLTDVNGKPVSKATVLSTIKIVSYQVNCTTLVGDPSTASAIGSPGKSGLKFLGNGRWQINWKTQKVFKNTCRNMFIQFNSVQSSPVVTFDFNKK